MDAFNLPADDATFSATGNPLDWDVLAELLAVVNSANPVIPESLVAHFVARAGCVVTDPNALKLIAASTHQLLSTVITDAQAYRVLRTGREADHTAVTAGDLLASLSEKGVVLERPSFFVDQP